MMQKVYSKVPYPMSWREYISERFLGFWRFSHRSKVNSVKHISKQLQRWEITLNNCHYWYYYNVKIKKCLYKNSNRELKRKKFILFFLMERRIRKYAVFHVEVLPVCSRIECTYCSSNCRLPRTYLLYLRIYSTSEHNYLYDFLRVLYTNKRCRRVY